MKTTGNCITIFVMWFACVSSASSSKCPYDIVGCSCDSRTVTCYDLKTIPPLQTGADVTAVEEAIFTFGNINEISDNSLPPGLIVLKFTYTALANISDEAFDASADTLRTLSIKGATLKRLPSVLLKLSNLANLELSYTNLDLWDDAILQHLATSLTRLTLFDVGLTQWPTWLSFFHSLTSITVRNNELQPIPDDAFSSSKDTLVELNLISSGLTQIPKALSILQNLTILALSANTITETSGRPGTQPFLPFPFAHTMLALLLEVCGLTVIPDFTNLSNLVEIFLGENQISVLTTNSFPLSIMSLHLPNNKVTSVPDTMAKLTRLSRLDLSSNQIKDINLDIFPSNMTYLDLRYNQITEITDSTSTNSNSIDTLNLANNPISTISSLAFKNLVSLRYLYLDSTNLTNIPLALTSLTKLLYLTLGTVLPLVCPCPLPTDLVLLRQSLTYCYINGGSCKSGQGFSDYLIHSCQTNVAV